MSTNMTIDGYVVSFDKFKKFTSKNDKYDYDSCNLKINIANSSKDNGKTVYTMVDLYATGKTAEFLDQYEKGDRIICHADFNGVNTYQSGQETKANIKATVKNIILFAPKDKTSETNNGSVPKVNSNQQPSIPGQTPQMTPPQITPPQGFNPSTGTTPNIEIPQTNNTTPGRKMRGK